MPDNQTSIPPAIPGLPNFAEERVAVAVTMFSALATGEPTDIAIEPRMELVEWYPQLAELLDAFSTSVKSDLIANYEGDLDARADDAVEFGLSILIELIDTAPSLKTLSDHNVEVLALAVGSITAWWCFMEDSLLCTDEEAPAWIHLWIGLFIDLQVNGDLADLETTTPPEGGEQDG
ncbi:MAG: hypothetical protein ACYDEP_02590 [Acidimicrobiales bacterium]